MLVHQKIYHTINKNTIVGQKYRNNENAKYPKTRQYKKYDQKIAKRPKPWQQQKKTMKTFNTKTQKNENTKTRVSVTRNTFGIQMKKKTLLILGHWKYAIIAKNNRSFV